MCVCVCVCVYVCVCVLQMKVRQAAVQLLTSEMLFQAFVQYSSRHSRLAFLPHAYSAFLWHIRTSVLTQPLFGSNCDLFYRIGPTSI